MTGEEEETGVHADPSKRRASGAHMRASMGRLEFHKLAKDMRAQLLHMQRAAAPSAASLFDLGTLEDNLDIQLQVHSHFHPKFPTYKICTNIVTVLL